MLVASATGQTQKPPQDDPAAQLLDAWKTACRRAHAGDPWKAIADDLEVALAKAPNHALADTINEALNALLAAADQTVEPPDDPFKATPAELVALLTESRIVGAEGVNSVLIRDPLRLDGGAGAIIWDRAAVQPEHEDTDPALRAYKRGRAMVPALIDALEDMTATRCVYLIESSGQPGVILRRCDLALALLEAVTRCQFYLPTTVKSQWVRHRVVEKWLSKHEWSVRRDVAEAARRWWGATRDMSPVEARSWLISRSKYPSAARMIEMLIAEGRTARAIEHLRSLAIGNDGTLQYHVIEKLAQLGDRDGLELLTARIESEGTFTRDQLQLLVKYGGPREYKLIRRLFVEDIVENPEPPGMPSRNILNAIIKTTNPLAVPVLIEALLPMSQADGEPEGTSSLQLPARALNAAPRIQEITQRDFGYDSSANLASRIEAIGRIRTWWETEGRGIYGFAATRTRRPGGIP